MRQQLKEIKRYPLRTVWKKSLLPVNKTVPALPAPQKSIPKKEDNSLTTKNEKFPQKLELPPQPEGYIKYPDCDFF